MSILIKRIQKLKPLWTTTGFELPGLTVYAEKHLVLETRTGLMTMSMLLLILVLAAMGINQELGLGHVYFKTYLLVIVLSCHIFFSARNVNELKTLNMLGITLLILSAVAFVSIAHQTNGFTPLLFSNVLLLFMLVPMIPWGLREGLTVILLIYFMITLSIGGRTDVFPTDTVWYLQFFMLATGLISGTLVAFNTSVRKDDIKARFDLEKAHDRMYRLSNLDPLTGTWNRRFMPTALSMLAERFDHGVFHYVIFDLDAFKLLNDTHGHDYGDKILLLVSECFSAKLGNNGFLIRIGGDEFVLLAVSDQIDDLLEEIRDTLYQKLAAEPVSKNIGFGLSLGRVSTTLADSINLDVLYNQADEILYKIKRERYSDEFVLADQLLNQDRNCGVGIGSNWRLSK